jgi:peptidoglycan/xylan/chitin deacetylase (PgdA/CDA1 family)
MRFLSLAGLLVCWAGTAQGGTVAITVDDLPYAGALFAESAASVNRKLLDAFQRRHVPVTGFVIGNRVGPGRIPILREWTRRGFDLGNHTWSHSDFNELSVQQIENEIVQGETGIKPKFFRFPMNHTGDTREKHDAIAAFLAGRGYSVATCTIDTSDYVFNNAYLKMLANKDTTAEKRLRADYLAYTSVEIDYYAALDKQVLDYAPPEVMLLHDNRLNADVTDSVLALFEAKGYRFVSLDEAQSDAAYKTPDTDVSKFGQMWGYRWARERGVKVNGRLETDPPKWVEDYTNRRSGGASFR